MVFASTMGPIPQMNFAAPDVYLQATPAGPVPIPLLSIGFVPTKIPPYPRLLAPLPAQNLLGRTIVTASGPGPGVLSGMVCSSSNNIVGSFRFFAGPAPINRMLDPTMQNGFTPNSFGFSIVPSQVRFMVLA